MRRTIFYSVLITVIVFTQLSLADNSNRDNCRIRLIQDLNVEALDGEDESLLIIKNAYKNLAGLRLMRFLKMMSCKVEWKVEGVSSQVPFANTYEGKLGVLKYVMAVLSSIRLDEWHARYYVKQGNMINVHLYQEGEVYSTGKQFTMEIVHTWEIDENNKIILMREYNDTYAMAMAFDPDADPQLSLVSNDADYGIAVSGFNDSLNATLLLYDALGRGDIPTILDGLDDNIIWYLAGPDHITPMAGTFYGKEGVMEFFTQLGTTQKYLDFQLKRFVVQGSRIDLEFYEKIYVYATDKTYTADILHTVIFNDEGKGVSFRSYNDTYSVAAGHTPD